MNMEAYYKQIEGFTITKAALEQDESDDWTKWPTFILTKPGFAPVKITVSSDEEGNDAGFLFIDHVEG